MQRVTVRENHNDATLAQNMKTYDTLLALSKDQREISLKASVLRSERVANLKTATQKHVAKLFVAMIAAGECAAGEMRKHGILLTGKDIRENLQDVYGLTNVFSEVIAGTIEISEEEFDAMDSSKLALLSTFLGEKHRDKLPEAITAAKTGSAKDMRELKPKVQSKAEKELEELKAKAPVGTPVTFGFIATDIAADAPLVTSKQALARLKADFEKAANTEGKAGDDALTEMLYVFGSMMLSTAAALDQDAKEFIDELVASRAKSATAKTVEPATALQNVA